MVPGVVLVLLAGLEAISSVVAQTTCSATVPCETGCCDQYGVCGLGPDFCGPDVCINSCDAKAECNPDNWPSEYVNATTCPLNVCCSQYGFCGTTEEFCGNKTVTAPSCDASTQNITRVIGYYNSAAASRGCDGMPAYSIPQGVYSHIYFAFGSIDPDSFEVIPAEDSDTTLYPILAALQLRDPNQELWLSIGGWDFSDSDEPTATTFSDLAAASTSEQNTFFTSLISFMGTYGFTGVDIDWEYPVASDRNGRAEDFENYPKLLASLKNALSDYKYGLSITLPTSYWYLQNFDLTAMEPSVDWFNVMSYDLHGTWDITDVWVGPYLDAQTNLTEIKTALDLLWGVNVDPSKVTLGMAFYGRTYTLATPDCTEPGCEYLSAGTAGQCSDSAGILFNSEIEDVISQYNLTPTLYQDAAVKVITWDTDQWASYDDEETWKLKVDYAKSVCLGGVMVWSVDEDDSQDTFSNGLATAIGNAINLNGTTGGSGLTISELSTATTIVESQSDYCRFINCGETCPSGFSVLTREDKTSQLMLDSTECPPGSGQTQTLCCPTSTSLPTCQWRGFHNSGKCQGGCDAGEAEVGTITAGCHSGYQSACCTLTNSTQPWGECAWTSSCEKDDTCPTGYDQFVVGSRQGWGGRKTCTGTQNYNYCCKDTIPDAFTNCAWFGHQVSFVNTEYCSDACPSGAIRIAEESINIMWGAKEQSKAASTCIMGNEAYCCNGTTKTVSTVGPRSPSPDLTSTEYEFEFYLAAWLANPSCSPTQDAQYSATFYQRRDLSNLTEDSTSSSTSSTSVQDLTYAYLVRYIIDWITSPDPDPVLSQIWEEQTTLYGVQDEAANITDFQNQLYAYGDWSGLPTYDPQVMVPQTLCNIADSAVGVTNFAAASSVLCEYGETSSSNTKRLLVADLMSSRTVNGDQPSIYAAIQGINKGLLTFHYARWLQSSKSTQVILEVAYWIGPTPGVAPTAAYLATYGDTSHTVATDRWVVFHLHIGLDAGTFYQGGNNQFNFYPGVTFMSVYHSQTLNSGTSTQAPRAEYIFSNSYSTTTDTGTMTNYNTRSQALDCNQQGAPTRWYIGLDNANAVAGLRTAGRPSDYAEAMNQFGLVLYQQGILSNANLARIWPAVATAWGGGDFQMVKPNINGLNAYGPVSGAFYNNFDGAGKTVDISGTAPTTPSS